MFVFCSTENVLPHFCQASLSKVGHVFLSCTPNKRILSLLFMSSERYRCWKCLLFVFPAQKIIEKRVRFGFYHHNAFDILKAGGKKNDSLTDGNVFLTSIWIKWYIRNSFSNLLRKQLIMYIYGKRFHVHEGIKWCDVLTTTTRLMSDSPVLKETPFWLLNLNQIVDLSIFTTQDCGFYFVCFFVNHVFFYMFCRVSVSKTSIKTEH